MNKSTNIPSLSVIIPVFNSEEFLRGCLQSLADQTYPDMEVIMVNDGSTDGSERIMDEFVSRYANFIKINQPNAGAGAARNTGLNAARGEYIGFVDSDDFVDPMMYEKLMAAITEHQTDMSRCGLLHLKYPGYKLAGRTEFSSNESYRMNSAAFFELVLQFRTPGYCMLSVYRKELFNSIRFAEGVVIEDIYTMPKVYLAADEIVFTPQWLYFYRRREGSISSKSAMDTKGYHDWILAMNKLRDTIRQSGRADRLVAVFHQHIFFKIIQFTLAIRSQPSRKTRYGGTHPALGFLSESLLRELIDSPYLYNGEREVLTSMDKSFRTFCIKERVFAFRQGRIRLPALIGSCLKILLNDPGFAGRGSKPIPETDRSIQRRESFSNRELRQIETYG